MLQHAVSVPIHQDEVDEDDRETFTVHLAAAENATLGDAMATATILDDDVTAGVAPDASSVREGDVARFTVSLTGGPSTAPVAIGYRVAGTALAGIDYTMPAGSLTLVAGAATVRVTGAHASRYDLAVWLTNPEAPDSSFDIALRFLGTEPTPAKKIPYVLRPGSGKALSPAVSRIGPSYPLARPAKMAIRRSLVT